MFKKLTITTALIATGVITSLGYTAVAQTRPADRPATQSDRTTISSVDRNFIIRAAQMNLAEVQLSELALQRSTRASREVQQFAQQMVADHTRATERLSRLALDKNVILPIELDAQHRVIRNRLSKLSGEEFDREYLNVMNDDHNRSVELFQNQARQGEDPDVRAFARNTLPALRGHLRMVRAMSSNPTGHNSGSHSR
jgi:putative membrane protein